MKWAVALVVLVSAGSAGATVYAYTDKEGVVHLTNILAKLEVSDRTQAILVAVKRGIIQIE